jgi:glycosyltransferase involved in cell wall biosynthesis
LKLIANCFHYVHQIDSTGLFAYLEINDLCIASFHKNPQYESDFGNKIFDYMQGKKPIVASDCRPQQKLIEKYNRSIVYKNDDEMKEAIINQLYDKQFST